MASRFAVLSFLSIFSCPCDACFCALALLIQFQNANAAIAVGIFGGGDGSFLHRQTDAFSSNFQKHMCFVVLYRIVSIERQRDER